MPKIGKIYLTISGEGKEYEIHYKGEKKSSSGGFYIKDLPEDFYSLLPKATRLFPTESEIRNDIHLQIADYKKLKTQTRKVIVFSIFATDELCSDKTQFSRKIKAPLNDAIINIDSSHESGRRGFNITWGVYDRVTDGVQERYYKYGDLGKVTGGMKHFGQWDKKITLDYTPEIEEFFKSIESSMFKLLCAISDFFTTETPEHLIAKMTSGAKLLS